LGCYSHYIQHVIYETNSSSLSSSTSESTTFTCICFFVGGNFSFKEEYSYYFLSNVLRGKPLRRFLSQARVVFKVRCNLLIICPIEVVDYIEAWYLKLGHVPSVLIFFFSLSFYKKKFHNAHMFSALRVCLVQKTNNHMVALVE